MYAQNPLVYSFLFFVWGTSGSLTPRVLNIIDSDVLMEDLQVFGALYFSSFCFFEIFQLFGSHLYQCRCSNHYFQSQSIRHHLMTLHHYPLHCQNPHYDFQLNYLFYHLDAMIYLTYHWYFQIHHRMPHVIVFYFLYDHSYVFLWEAIRTRLMRLMRNF